MCRLAVNKPAQLQMALRSQRGLEYIGGEGPAEGALIYTANRKLLSTLDAIFLM